MDLKEIDTRVHLTSIILRNFIDRKYFFALLKKNQSNNILSVQSSIILFDCLKNIYHKNTDDNSLIFDNIENYLIIISDSLMLSLLKKEIEKSSHDEIKREIEIIRAEIQNKKMNRNSSKDDYNHSSMLKFFINSNRDDFLVENIKI